MSVIGFMLKSKKEMAKTDTKHVKIGKYEVTSHAQNRVVDASRQLKKKDMVINLLGNSKNSPAYRHHDGSMQYDRVNEKNRTLTHIIQKKNTVKSIYKFHNTNSGRKNAYKNF